MTAAEIIARVKSGETVQVSRIGVNVFMRECAAHNLSCSVVVTVGPDACTISPPSVLRP